MGSVPRGTFEARLKNRFSHYSPVARRKRPKAPGAHRAGRSPTSAPPASSKRGWGARPAKVKPEFKPNHPLPREPRCKLLIYLASPTGFEPVLPP